MNDADNVERFRKYYENEDDGWGGGSGAGSNPHYVLPYRQFLENFLYLNNIRTVVDIGCGDWAFSRFLNLEGVHYRGFDVVESVVQKNRDRFGSASVRFDIMPADLRQVPRADLLIMKDVLQHLPNHDIFRHRAELFDRYPRCLITNSYRKLDSGSNVDIYEYGSFRCLDLNGPPYMFGGTYVLEFSSPIWEELRTLLYIPPAHAPGMGVPQNLVRTVTPNVLGSPRKAP